MFLWRLNFHVRMLLYQTTLRSVLLVSTGFDTLFISFFLAHKTRYNPPTIMTVPIMLHKCCQVTSITFCYLNRYLKKSILDEDFVPPGMYWLL